MSTKEYDIFCLLAANKDIVLTDEQIYQKIWKEEPFGNEHIAVGSHVRSMRQKLYAAYPEPPFAISCIRDIGYRLERDS
ncbi:MAG: winged helix-turn-helix domain-containing protein [Candidatus Pararuminococcus gallinarum]